MVFVSGIRVKSPKASFFFRLSFHKKKKEERIFSLLRDQPHLIVIEEIIPCPVEHHKNSVAKANDAVDVQEHPDHPGNESAEGDAEDARHGGVASNGGEKARVFVMEWERFFAIHYAADVLGGGLSLLNGNRGDHR